MKKIEMNKMNKKIARRILLWGMNVFLCSAPLNLKAQNLLQNGDFESLPANTCDCPANYTCANDVGIVIDGVSPTYTTTAAGCLSGTAYAPVQGAHSGSNSVSLYAGNDNLEQTFSPTVTGTYEFSAWVAGPVGYDPGQQGTISTEFQVRQGGVYLNGVGVQVALNQPWTEVTFTVFLTAGVNYEIKIFQPVGGSYITWVDDIFVGLPCDAGNVAPTF